jgi:site-specific DNA-methyltransferase (adenine-specific)
VGVDVEALLGPTGRIVAPGCGLVEAEAREWLATLPDRCLHAVVTDPPYGGLEYEAADLGKLRAGRGGVWRIPPTLDGVRRNPVPRFTVLRPVDEERLRDLFDGLARELARVLVPGAHLLVASQPLVSSWVFEAFARAGLERRGAVIRTLQTLRGGDRPKNAHLEFPEVTVMPRSGWEPWGLFRVPLEGTVAENLRTWGTGGLRRPSPDQPFRDLIACAPTRPSERRLAPHPSLKPQRFLRQVVRAVLPLGEGIVLDPFAGSGSTVAAAAAVGYRAIGVERDPQYVALAAEAVPRLAALPVRGPQ